MQERLEIHRAIAALQRLCELFALRRQQLAADAGLTESQWRLLEEIADESFMPSMFARRRDCTPAAISRGLRSLLERGWVTAEIASGDARQRRYRLTAEGRRVLDQLRRGRAARLRVVRGRALGSPRGVREAEQDGLSKPAKPARSEPQASEVEQWP